MLSSRNSSRLQRSPTILPHGILGSRRKTKAAIHTSRCRYSHMVTIRLIPSLQRRRSHIVTGRRTTPRRRRSIHTLMGRCTTPSSHHSLTKSRMYRRRRSSYILTGRQTPSSNRCSRRVLTKSRTHRRRRGSLTCIRTPTSVALPRRPLLPTGKRQGRRGRQWPVKVAGS